MALDRLGDQLPIVAQAHGKTPDELRAIFKRDPMLWLGELGNLNYVCEWHHQDADAENVSNDAADAERILPVEQTFFLHSRPGASKVIFLDFDGHVTSGLHWNANYNNGQDIVTPPYDTDGNPSAFSATELGNIQHIWQCVAEDFAPYEVDVTTEDPGVERLSKTSSTDGAYGIRVCLGGSSGDWYNGSAGGTANLGSFSKNTDTPCFVFPENLGNGNKKYVSDAASHEIGHTLGLHHDGVTGGSSYYTGHGDWAPIMGVAYYVSIGHWSKGEYPNANNQEDDLAVMQNYGVRYRADDHGDWMANATPLPGSTVSVSGVVETKSDVDLFSFQSGDGLIEFSVFGPSPSPSVDIMLGLYNGSGSLISYSDPTDLDATLSATVTTGTYYLSVEGVGAGTLSTGYPDYGSVGEYVLNGTLSAGGTVQPPVAMASATPSTGVAPLTVNLSSLGSHDPDGTIVSYDWELGDGNSTMSPNPTHVYTNPGTYEALLIVTDDDGLSANETVTIVATTPPNIAPIAVATAEPVSGYVPVTVAFSSAGSYDPDGSLVEFFWDFADGETSSNSTPIHTYTTPGVYSVQLTVTDNRGGTNSDKVVIQVSQDPNSVIFVQSISLELQSRGRNASTEALVRIVDQNGVPRPNAMVSGRWSGLVSESVSGETDFNGEITFASETSKDSGSFTFAVQDVALSGYNYEPARNVETNESIDYSNEDPKGGGPNK